MSESFALNALPHAEKNPNAGGALHYRRRLRRLEVGHQIVTELDTSRLGGEVQDEERRQHPRRLIHILPDKTATAATHQVDRSPQGQGEVRTIPIAAPHREAPARRVGIDADVGDRLRAIEILGEINYVVIHTERLSPRSLRVKRRSRTLAVVSFLAQG